MNSQNKIELKRLFDSLISKEVLSKCSSDNAEDMLNYYNGYMAALDNIVEFNFGDNTFIDGYNNAVNAANFIFKNGEEWLAKVRKQFRTKEGF